MRKMYLKTALASLLSISLLTACTRIAIPTDSANQASALSEQAMGNSGSAVEDAQSSPNSSTAQSAIQPSAASSSTVTEQAEFSAPESESSIVDSGAATEPTLSTHTPSNPNLNELEILLNESGIMSWLSDDFFQSKSNLDTLPVYAIASQWLRMQAARNAQEIRCTVEGVPYFPVEDYTIVTNELLGCSFDYESLAAGKSTDVAPDEMLCVAWGYDTANSEIVVQRDSLEMIGNQYRVILENSFYSPGDEATTRLEKITFTLNPSYRFSPYCFISVEDLGVKP